MSNDSAVGSVANLRFEGVQALRFVAALLVVLTHSTFYVSERLLPGFSIWVSGAAGVDVFFVISGFVMVVSTRSLSIDPTGAKAFIARRLVRVVPLYWIATSIKVIAVIAIPAALVNSAAELPYVIKSYLLFPALNQQGLWEPIHAVGWTLIFEMFFYLSFALAMAARIPPVRFITSFFVLLSVLALSRTAQWPAVAYWCNSIVLEFLMGAWIGRACLKGVRAPPGICLAMLILGSAGLLWPWGVLPEMIRFLNWGVPAALIVAAVAGLEPVLRGRLSARMLMMGDASYGLYLFHPFVAPIPAALLAKLNWPNAPLSIAASVVLAVTVSVLVYRFCERPLNASLRRVFVPKPAPA